MLRFASLSVNHQCLTRTLEVLPLFKSVASASSQTICCFQSQSTLSQNVRRKLSSLSKKYTDPVRIVPNVLLTDQPHRNAGHSKWANIKHVKQATDMARSKELNKYANYMKAAVREQGSADPKINNKLANLITQAKEAKLPMSSIDKILQSLQATKDCKHCVYPIKGPGSCIMLLDLESPNLVKTKQELSTILRKNKGIPGEDTMTYLFDHKGFLYCSEIDGKPVNEELLDNATEHAIESGANDVELLTDHPEYGTVLEFVTEPSAFIRVKTALEGLKYKIDHAEVSYIPKQFVELAETDFEAAEKLYTKLLDHQDVQKIYANIA